MYASSSLHFNKTRASYIEHYAQREFTRKKKTFSAEVELSDMEITQIKAEARVWQVGMVCLFEILTGSLELCGDILKTTIKYYAMEC